MSDAIFVRPMCHSDLAACAVIEATTPDGWALPQLASELSAALQGGAPRLFVAQQGGAPLALAAWQLAAGEASLHTFTVAPFARRHKVGQTLLAAAMQALAAQGATRFFLEVRQSNAAAIALYTAAGFCPQGVRKNFYKNPPEHALIMAAEW